VLRGHIRTVVGHYRGKVTEWDVVNEAIDDKGAMRDSVWMRVIGPDYIDLAFQWAHEADPDAKLYYNDYELEYPGAKADAVAALVRGLVDRDTPIDGVGFQAHQLTVRKPTPTTFEAALRSYADLGLDVAITELDVGIYLPAKPANLEEQAVIYRDALATCLAVSRCRTLVTWGYTDKYSWIPGELAGFGDALPFDAAYRPKPAAKALRTELAGDRRVPVPE
jgi:endo-1,4-beta-xylanase